MNARGVVISVHTLGATVRLLDGSLAAVPSREVSDHRSLFLSALQRGEPLSFRIERHGNRLSASPDLESPGEPLPATPVRLHDNGFEAMMNAYLSENETVLQSTMRRRLRPQGTGGRR